jgi:hypothetical protein
MNFLVTVGFYEFDFVFPLLTNCIVIIGLLPEQIVKLGVDASVNAL